MTYRNLLGHRVDCIGHRRFKDCEADVRVLGPLREND